MDRYKRRAAAFGTELVDLATIDFTPGLLRCLPAELARKYHVLPVAESGKSLAIVIGDPSDLDALDGLGSALNRELELRVADGAQIDSFIERLYGKG